MAFSVLNPYAGDLGKTILVSLLVSVFASAGVIAEVVLLEKKMQNKSDVMVTRRNFLIFLGSWFILMLCIYYFWV